MCDEHSDYERDEEHETEEEQVIVKDLKGGKIGCKKGRKASLSQTMSDYVYLRSREKQATMIQQKEQQQVAPLHERNKHKSSTCQRSNGKRRVQRILLGSMALYLKMRQKQHLKKNNVGEMEMFQNEEPFDEQDDEQSDEQDNDASLEDIRTSTGIEALCIENEVQKERQVLVTNTTEKGSTVKKTKGPTVLAEVHNRKF